MSAPLDDKKGRDAGMLPIETSHRLPHNQWRHDAGGHPAEIV